MSIDPFFVTIALLFVSGLVIAGRQELDERRWRRERDAESAAQHPAE